MKILIDIGHPAHVHLFKNIAWALEKKGHEVFFTVRDKGCSAYLLEKYGCKYIVLGKFGVGFLRKIACLFRFVFKTLKFSVRFHPDLFLSHGSIAFAFVSKLMRKPHISMEDTGNLEQIFLYKPFTDIILSPESLKLNLGKKHITYRGYHELAYLHPKYFSVDSSVLAELGVKESEKFVIIRFSAQNATHDFGYKGMPLKYKIKCVEEFSKYAKVFISSEEKTESCLDKFNITIPPEKMHAALYHAALVYSEGAKTASEAALLGTPAIYVDFKGRDYTREQEEKYGTIFNFGSSFSEYEKSIQKGIEILSDSFLKEKWRGKKEKIMEDNIDTTAFMVWFVENYPESFAVLKKDGQYQLKFK
ncbi:MAG: DUF354 domain-containing protein [Candidatus Omnitrophota bacterium]